MVRLYTLILAITAMIMAMSVAFISTGNGRKQSKLSEGITQMLFFGMVCCLAYMMAISTKSMLISQWSYIVYFAGIDWILVSMLFYARQYTRVWVEKTSVTVIYVLLAVLDNASIIMNFKLHHVFSLKWVDIGENDGCFIFDRGVYFPFHLVYCYILIAVVFLIFIVKILKMPGFHKGRYITVFAMLSIIISLNAVFLFYDFTLDVSVAFYAIAALFIAYFSKANNPRAFVEYMLSTIAERMDCALITFDENDECIYTNELAGRIFGISSTKFIVEDWFRKWKKNNPTNSIQSTSWNDVYEVNGEECRFDIHFTKIYDNHGHYSGCYFSFYDVTSDYVAYEEEKFRSTHDSLTGGFNRDGFYEEVRKILNAYPTTEYMLVCSDIKGFKLVNDMFGLDMADKILVKISEEIRSRIQGGSCFARLEADRFAVLVPKDRFDEKVFLAGVRNVEYVLNSANYRMNILLGVYEVTDRSVTVASMCDRAFLAIDSIKDAYKSQIAYYGDMLRKEYLNEQKIIAEFENALASGQFAMYLQPIVGRDGSCNFAEALVRWIHPEKGVIAPGGFVPVLENTGYIFKLDTYVWEQACKRLAYWTQMGNEETCISVNISVKDFYYIDIYETLIGLVEQYHIDPKRLKLEITESVFMTEKDRQLDIMYALKDYGFIIEIDDFGSGYSSLNMLKEVPANVLKIDMGFLEKTDNEDRSRTIVSAVIGLAKALDMDIIVEGVETAEQLEFLKEAGCDLFQGYYFNKPIDVRSFEVKYLNRELID